MPEPNAVVTLDVLHTGVMWGGYVTMNFWAKSVATGVFLLGPLLLGRELKKRPELRLWIPFLALAFTGLTLLFTVLDLHQPFRFWHMFVWPHLTSTINLGSWLLSAYSGLLVLLLYAAYRKLERLYDLLFYPTALIAFGATIYTAGIMGQATAREIWQAPTEVAQTLLTAVVAGSALLLFLRLTDEERLLLGKVLGLSSFVALVIAVVELVFAHQKSEEGGYIVHLLLQGELGPIYLGGLAAGLLFPALLAAVSVGSGSTRPLRFAAVVSLVGLWAFKHAWLIAPQLIPLS